MSLISIPIAGKDAVVWATVRLCHSIMRLGLQIHPSAMSLNPLALGLCVWLCQVLKGKLERVPLRKCQQTELMNAVMEFENGDSVLYPDLGYK